MYDGGKPNPKNPVINVCSTGSLTSSDYNLYFSKNRGDDPSVMDNKITNATDYCNDEGYNPPVVLGNIVASSVSLEVIKLAAKGVKKLKNNKTVSSEGKFTSSSTDVFFNTEFRAGEPTESLTYEPSPPTPEQTEILKGANSTGPESEILKGEPLALSKRAACDTFVNPAYIPTPKDSEVGFALSLQAEEAGAVSLFAVNADTLVNLTKLPIQGPTLLYAALGKTAIGVVAAGPRALAALLTGGTEGAANAFVSSLKLGFEDGAKFLELIKNFGSSIGELVLSVIAAVKAIPAAISAISVSIEEAGGIVNFFSKLIEGADVFDGIAGIAADIGSLGLSVGVMAVQFLAIQVVLGLLEFGFEELDEYIGESTAEYASSYCHNIGDRFEFMNSKNYIGKGDNRTNTLSLTEWAPFDTYNDYNSCHFNDGHRGYKVDHSAACCKGNCSIIGSGLRCARQNFLGDATVCCFNDYNCNQENEDSCFQTPARQRTCPPTFRNLNSNNCRSTIEAYCTGDALFPSQSDWLEMWLEDSYVEINSFMAVENLTVQSDRFNPSENTSIRGQKYPGRQKQPCLRAIARAVTPDSSVCTWDDLQGAGVIQGNINSDGFIWSKKIIDSIYNKFVTENDGVFIGGINQDGYNRNSGFYSMLWDVCNKIPGLCVDILPKICQAYTPESLINTPDALPWCSCWMPDSSYEKYEKFGIQRECSPLCNRPGVLPYLDNNFLTKVCVQSVCMMDDITVGLINTNFKNGVNFNQICGSCGATNISNSFSVTSLNTGETGVKSYLIRSPFNIQGKYTSVYGTGYSVFQSGRVPCYIIPTNGFTIGKNTYTLGGMTSNPENFNFPLCVLVIGEDTDNNVGVVAIEDYSVPFSNPGDENVIQVGDYIDIGTEVTLNYTFPSWDNDFRTEGKIKVTVGIIPIPRLSPTDIGTGSLKPITSGTEASTSITNILSRTSSNAVLNNSVSETSSYITKANRQIASDNCRCIMDNSTYAVLESKVGTINLSQHCGNTSTCTNSQGENITCGAPDVNVTSYQDLSSIEVNTSFQEKQEKYSNIFFLLLAGLFALLLIFLVGTSARKYDRMNFSRF